VTSSLTHRIAWSVAAIVAAAGFFALALNWEVYRETSPPHLAADVLGQSAMAAGRPFGISLHIALRKLYSIVAFAIVGATAQQALPGASRPTLRMMLLVAAYSGAIEAAQWRAGSSEGLAWNAVDVACGAAGGYLAIVVDGLIRRRRAPAG
jgi:hypothetical protein